MVDESSEGASSTNNEFGVIFLVKMACDESVFAAATAGTVDAAAVVLTSATLVFVASAFFPFLEDFLFFFPLPAAVLPPRIAKDDFFSLLLLFLPNRTIWLGKLACVEVEEHKVPIATRSVTNRNDRILFLAIGFSCKYEIVSFPSPSRRCVSR